MCTNKQKFETTLIKMIGMMIVAALFICAIESDIFRISEVIGMSK